jgi:hypothetical protein
MRKCVHEAGVGDGRERIYPDTLCNQVITGGQENANALSARISSAWPSKDSTCLLGIPLAG